MTFPAKLKFEFMDMLTRNKISYSHNTNYFQEMLDLSPGLESELKNKSIKEERLSPKMKSIEYTKEECVDFLMRLYAVVNLMPVHSEAAKNAKAIFLKTCQNELENRRIRDLVIA